MAVTVLVSGMVAITLSGQPTMDDTRSRVDQLTSPGRDGRPIEQPVAPPTPVVGQVAAPPDGRHIEGSQRLSPEARGATPRQLASPGAGVRVAAPPQEAIDLCQAAGAGQATPPPGLDCSVVLEALAFARRSPEQTLLIAAEEEFAGRSTNRGAERSAIPNATIVAQGLALGIFPQSQAAQAVAAGAPPAPEPAPEPPSPVLPPIPGLD